MNEGYVKFECNWEKQPVHIPDDLFISFGKHRAQLCRLGLIGAYPDGIGYGNISIRSGYRTFFITGSSTGLLNALQMSHYSEVLSYSIPDNSVDCKGLTKASAESLTHAAIYESVGEAGAVVHVHCQWLWEELLDQYPTTPADIEYGTPEMAFAVQSLAKEAQLLEDKIIIMGGHREGIITFGRNLEEATGEIIKLFNRHQK